MKSLIITIVTKSLEPSSVCKVYGKYGKFSSLEFALKSSIECTSECYAAKCQLPVKFKPEMKDLRHKFNFLLRAFEMLQK